MKTTIDQALSDDRPGPSRTGLKKEDDDLPFEKVALRLSNREECPLMLTCEEIAEILGCHVVTVRRWCADGELPAVRIGRRWYVSRERLLGR